MVERERAAFKRAIEAGGAIEHGDVWFNAFFFDQPGKVGCVAITGIGDNPLRPQSKALERTLDHPALRSLNRPGFTGDL